MALREVSIPVRFAGGIETKMDSKAVPSTRLLGLENAVFSKAVSLSKARGYSSLPTAVLGASVPYSKARGLAARDTELVLFTEGSSYSYIEGASAWNLIRDGVMSVRQSDESLVKTISEQTACDYAACNGIALVCWEDSRGGVYYAVTESDRGRVIVSAREASSTGAMPRAVRCDTKLMLLWSEAALGQIRIIVVDTVSPHAPSSAAVLVDGLVTTLANFDASYVDAESEWERAAACITWNATDGIHVAWLDPSGVIGSPGTGWNGAHTFTPAAAVTAGPVIGPSRGRTASNVWALAWATASDTYVAVTSGLNDPAPIPPLTVNLAATATGPSGTDRLAVTIVDGQTGTVQLWAEDRAATVRNSIVRRRAINANTGAVSSPPQDTLRGCVLASSAWVDYPADFDSDAGDLQRAFVTLLHPTPLQSTYLTVRDDALCVAQTLPGNAGDPSATHRLPRVVDTDGDRIYEWAAVYKGKLDAINGDQFTEAGPRLVSLDFGPADAYQTAYVGRTLYLGGAVPMAYDGVSWVEAQPFYAPDWESGATLHTLQTTGSIANGVYSYIFWYEWTLANGEIVRGPTSKPYSVTLAGADDQVTLTIPTLRLSAFGREAGTRENCRIGVARSQAGDASVYYRIDSLDPSTAGAANGYVANDQQADTVSFIDAISDANMLLRGEPHYTTGGVPSNDAIAASGVIAEGKGRLFLASSSDPNTVYHSQERAEGYGIELTPELKIGVPPGGGAITGIVVMDDAVLIFKRSAIYRVTGPGPLPDPTAGGGWTAPVQVTSDVGCIDQRTLVMTPAGIMFQSAKGIYLLDVSRGVSYVGAAVEAYNDQTIVRATVIEDSTQVRFLTSSGLTLLYDYLFGQWSTFTNHEGLDAVNVNGLYHYLRNDGRVFRQAETFASANLPIPMVIETAWIRLGEARQGFQRIWHLQLLGTWKSPHTLKVQYKTDYKDGADWSEPVSFDATSMGGDNYGDGPYGEGNYGGDSPEPYEWKVHLGLKCEAVQFRFSFVEEYSASASYGACAELTEMLITGGVKGAMNKLPAARMG